MPTWNNKEPISYSKTKSRFVEELCKELNIDKKTLAIFYNRAKAKVALANNCKISEKHYGTIINIFKKEIIKYFPDVSRRFPKTFPKDFFKHRHDSTETLDEVIKRYRRDIRLAKKKCGDFYKIS